MKIYLSDIYEDPPLITDPVIKLIEEFKRGVIPLLNWICFDRSANDHEFFFLNSYLLPLDAQL